MFLIEIIYWLLIYEGALRKWILIPGLDKVIYFIRDPFLLYFYIFCFRKQLCPPGGKLWQYSWLVFLLFVCLGIVQVLNERNTVFTLIFGLRLYFWSIPLAFIAEKVLKGVDLRRIAKRTLLISIPMAILVFFQYRSPPGSFINRMVDLDSSFTYGELVRVSGTFAFTQGHAFFCTILFAFLMATILLPRSSRPLNGWLLLGAAIATCVNILLDGNRQIFYLIAFPLLSSWIYRFSIAKNRLSFRSFIPEIVIVLSAIAYVTVFSDAFAAMAHRFDGASVEQRGRVYDLLWSMAEPLFQKDMLGAGLGSDTLGGRALLGAMRRIGVGVTGLEPDLGHTLVEAGPLGLFYVLLRWLFAFHVAYGAFKASKRTGNPLPLMLCGFTTPLFLFGTMINNGTSNGFAWMFLGMSLAANRIGIRAQIEGKSKMPQPSVNEGRFA